MVDLIWEKEPWLAAEREKNEGKHLQFQWAWTSYSPFQA
jgi:hypothetical protein